MAQPQVFINDYTDKSIVLRSDPEDFFKPYSTYLTQAGGKWNPNLKDPSGQGRLGGWIFPKSKRQTVEQTIGLILSGQVQPQASSYPRQTLQTQTLSALQRPFTQSTFIQPSQSLLTSLHSRNLQPLAQGGQSPSIPSVLSAPQPGGQSPRFIQGGQSPSIPSVLSAPQPGGQSPRFIQGGQSPRLSIQPLAYIPEQIPLGQQAIVFLVPKPQQGETMYFSFGNQKVPVTVESVRENNGVTTEAIIRLPDNQVTNITLNGLEWKIPGFNQPHTITSD